MAVTTVQSNNKLLKFERDINMEFMRGNKFSPYMGTALTSIIRVKHVLKNGGEQINMPIVTRLKGRGVGSGTLTGNEEAIDNYGMRAWIDWARNAVKTDKADQHKDSADIFGKAKPLLSQWGKERQRDDVVEAFMSLPSESAPTGLNSDDGQTINGILYEAATAAQRNTWNASNSDRVLYGAAKSNYNATHATALANIDTTNDKLTKGSLKLLKRVAKAAQPQITPYSLKDGYEGFVLFAGTNTFRDIADDLESVNQAARARELDGMKKNPIFMDGDLVYDKIIIREVPEISTYVSDVWTTLKTAGNSSTRVEPVFLCGQQALAFCWGQEAKSTSLDMTDYGFKKGSGVEMAYGVAKMFKKHGDSDDLKQWGVVTGFFSGVEDA